MITKLLCHLQALRHYVYYDDVCSAKALAALQGHQADTACAQNHNLFAQSCAACRLTDYCKAGASDCGKRRKDYDCGNHSGRGAH